MRKTPGLLGNLSSFRDYGPRPDLCTVPDCGRPCTQDAYCAGHYQRWRRTGDPGPAELRAYRRKASRP